MDPLTAARCQMTVSLAFHMVFAAVGIGLPLLLVIVEARYLRTRDPELLDLAHRWSKTIGLLFAVGAVSGTALAMELTLLWPHYMEILGAAVGHLFALEGVAFFVEAIFIGLYLYGWDRLTPLAHWWCGVAIAASGMLSGALVLGVNAWMQEPVGAQIVAGRVVTTDPLAVFLHPRWWQMAIHSTLACYAAVSFAVAGWYALQLLRAARAATPPSRAPRTALLVAMSVGGVSALLQAVSGDALARTVFRSQPVKFAAFEALFETQTYAPLTLGGWPDVAARRTRFGIEVPGALSFLATHDPSARIQGLEAVPQSDWPNVVLTHLAFDAMVGAGTVLIVVTVAFWATWLRRRDAALDARWLLRVLVVATPLGFLGLEAGWFVTEVGRQPWAIDGVIRTADSVTSAAGVPAMFATFTALYLLLAATVLALLHRIATNPTTMKP